MWKSNIITSAEKVSDSRASYDIGSDSICGEPNVLITADVAVVMETLLLLAFLISFSMSMFKKAVALNLRK